MSILHLGNVHGLNTGVQTFRTPFGKAVWIIGVCDVTTTAQTILVPKMRSSQVERDDTTIPTIPVGAFLYRLGIKVPSGLVATNGDRLKLATAVGATGTQTFDNAASTAYVATGVAASTTFAAGDSKFEIFPFQQGAAATQSAAITSSARTFRLYNDNGTTGAGSGVSVASGTAQIIVDIRYIISDDVPTVEETAARPARQTVVAT